jgi:virginiamycin B lyase
MVSNPIVLVALALMQGAGPVVPIKEWTVPWPESRPRDPAVAPDGRIWFVGQVGNYVARLDPATGKFDKFTIDNGTHPHNVIVDPAGNGWYAGNQNGMIGRIDGKTGAVTRFPMPEAAAGDPHTLTFDPAGDIWFTVQNGNFVGHLTTKTGQVRLLKVPTSNARPYGITIDREGRPWIDLFGTNRLASVDPKTMVLTEHALPDPKGRPRRIATTADGAIWYDDFARGYLGRFDPRTAQVKEWPMPGGNSSFPYAMTVDDRDRLWMVETGANPNRLVGFDPKAEKFFSVTPIPSGGGVVRYMVFDRKGNQIWFGTDLNTIGRAELSKLSKPTA